MTLPFIFCVQITRDTKLLCLCIHSHLLCFYITSLLQNVGGWKNNSRSYGPFITDMLKLFPNFGLVEDHFKSCVCVFFLSQNYPERVIKKGTWIL